MIIKMWLYFVFNLKLSLSTPAQTRVQPKQAEDLFVTPSKNRVAGEV